jgi:hypothetical protein
MALKRLAGVLGGDHIESTSEAVLSHSELLQQSQLFSICLVHQNGSVPGKWVVFLVSFSTPIIKK